MYLAMLDLPVIEADGCSIVEVGRVMADVNGWRSLLHIQISRNDGARMTRTEVQSIFNRVYPGRWGYEVYPPAEHYGDLMNAYHLWVMPATGESIKGMRLGTKEKGRA